MTLTASSVGGTSRSICRMAAVDRGNHSFSISSKRRFCGVQFVFPFFLYFDGILSFRGSTVRLCSHVMIAHATMYDSTCIGSGKKKKTFPGEGSRILFYLTVGPVFIRRLYCGSWFVHLWLGFAIWTYFSSPADSIRYPLPNSVHRWDDLW